MNQIDRARVLVLVGSVPIRIDSVKLILVDSELNVKYLCLDKFV